MPFPIQFPKRDRLVHMQKKTARDQLSFPRESTLSFFIHSLQCDKAKASETVEPISIIAERSRSRKKEKIKTAAIKLELKPTVNFRARTNILTTKQ